MLLKQLLLSLLTARKNGYRYMKKKGAMDAHQYLMLSQNT
jgi:hypothetical protein